MGGRISVVIGDVSPDNDSLRTSMVDTYGQRPHDLIYSVTLV